MRRSPLEVAAILQAFLTGTGAPWDWDDFVSIGITDADLDAIRARCAGLPEEFPARDCHEYCSAAGLDVIRGFIAELERAVEQPDAADGASRHGGGRQ